MTTLSEVERGLALFTQGITDRIPVIRSAESTSQTITNSGSYELVLPIEIRHFDKPELNRDVYYWLALQQIAFRYFDTLSFKIDMARQRIPHLGEGKTPSSSRATDLELFYHHFPLPDIAQHLFFSLEQARVGHLITLEFPGSLKLRDLHRSCSPLGPQSCRQPSFPALDHLEAALQTPSLMNADERQLVDGLFSESSDVYTSAKATVRCYQAFFSQAITPDHDLFEDSQQGEVSLPGLQRVARLEEWETELSDLDAELQALAFSEDQSSASLAEDDEGIEGSIRESVLAIQSKRDQMKRRVDMEKSLLTNFASSSNLERPHFRYDEWDYLNGSWLRRWCSVFEIQPQSVETESTNQLLQDTKPLVHQVRKQFEQLRPLGLQSTKGFLNGEQIDFDAVIKMRLDRRAGVPANYRIYKRLSKKQRDISACFLVDLSASTDDPVKKDESKHLPEDDADPFDDPYLHGAIDFDPDQTETQSPRKIIDIQKESVLLLGTALDELGDMYAIYGFSGYGRECVEIHVAKDFRNSLDFRALNAIAAMKPLRSTRMGPAIRHATSKLLATGTSLKLLMVISDGFPQDCDYGPDRSDHEYGIQDTAKAIQEAKEKGVRVFCITVDLSGHDYLKRMCQPDQYLVIEETIELPMALQRAYQSLTS